MGCDCSKPDRSNMIAIEDAQYRDLEVRVSSDKGKKISLRSAAMAVRVASVRNPLINRAPSNRDAKRASLLGNSSTTNPSTVNATSGSNPPTQQQQTHHNYDQPGALAQQQSSHQFVGSTTSYPGGSNFVQGPPQTTMMLHPFTPQQGKTMSNLSNRSMGYGSEGGRSGGGVTVMTNSVGTLPGASSKSSPNDDRQVYQSTAAQRSVGPPPKQMSPMGEMDVQSIGDDDEMDS